MSGAGPRRGPILWEP